MGKTGVNYGAINKDNTTMNKSRHLEEDVEQSEQLLEQLGYKQARVPNTIIYQYNIYSFFPDLSKIGLIFIFRNRFFRNCNENYLYSQHLVCERVI